MLRLIRQHTTVQGHEQPRVIQVGKANVSDGGRQLFCDNSVVNSKYTLINFVPRSLFEQFRRLANVYFLVMGGLMLLGTYSPVFQTPLGALTTLFPLSIVLVISMVQEGLADLKRHRADDETNNRPASVISFSADGRPSQSESVLWRNIRVGDILRISDKQALPADVMLIYTSEDEHIAYIETSQIDGETNLKLRRAVSLFPHERATTADEALAKIMSLRASVECEGPNVRINSFTGVCKPAEAAAAPVPIDIENIILRGSMLRNTRWAYGVVVYTGNDTKIQRNSRAAPSKMSRIDDLVNRAIYVILLLDVLLVTISTILLMDFEAKNFAHLTYLGFRLEGETPAAEVARLPNGVDWQSSKTSFVSGWLTFFVLFNNFVPISMYVTLEVITYFHLFLINEDLDLYHAAIDMPAKARSNNVTDLGQVEYVFSDKTGTLTENVMKFKRCSIEGKIYGAPVLHTPGNRHQAYVPLNSLPPDAPRVTEVDMFLKVLALCHTVVVERTGLELAAAAAAAGEQQQHPQQQSQPPQQQQSQPQQQQSQQQQQQQAQQQQQPPAPGAGADANGAVVTKVPTIVVAPRAASGNSKSLQVAAASSSAAGGIVGGGIEYQAESPDEKALVEAAADLGYVLTGRTTQQICISLAGRTAVYEPLAVNKFDSDRKRMSIFLRDPTTGTILLLCKGADTAMLSRGVFKSEQARATTVEHLRLFSEEGLRTLMLACREVAPREFEEWMQRYQAAALSDQRATNMSRVADEIEKDLTVVGVTAIEDKLQDGVPDTIANLSLAGIKVCVLTGDKMETAINIGYSCKVLREGMVLLQLSSGGSGEPVEKGLCQLYKTVTDRHPVPWSMGERLRGERSVLRRAVQAKMEKSGGGASDVEQAAAGGGAKIGGNGSQPLMPTTTDQPTATVAPLTPTSSTSTDNRLSRSGKVTWVPSSPRALFRALEVALLSPSKVAAKNSLVGSQDCPFAFIMEGPALVHVLGDPVLESMLFHIMQCSVAVIACRVSPKQKALLVRLVKHNVSPVPVTLAIGDGANDVGMIQEAHVGVGISGNEGQQAVNASDFAVAQFRFLQRLLLVHGRWNYRRMCKTVLYSFYKNLVLVMTLFLFLFHCGFAGTSLFEDNILAGYNFFLGLQIFTLGLFDKDVSAEYAMKHPQMYASGRDNMDLNSFQVVKWIITALLHGFFVYFFSFWLSSNTTIHDQASFYVYGLSVYSTLIILMNLKVLLEFKTITYPGFASRRRRRRRRDSDGAAMAGIESSSSSAADGGLSLTGLYRNLAGGGNQNGANAGGGRVHPEGPVTKVAAQGETFSPPKQEPCAVGWTLVFWFGSLVLFFFVSLVYNAMLSFAPNFFAVADATWSQPLAWLQMLLVPCICIGIDILWDSVQAQLAPSLIRLGVEENRLLGVNDGQ